VEYLVREARITDIERLVAMSDGALRAGNRESPLDAADLLRQLVYLPSASVFVAEARREVVGGAMLALRPSVRAGVDPGHDEDRVTDALLEEILRSARNKACTVVEAAGPSDPGERIRWDRQGFREAGPLMYRTVAVEKAAARRT
jgi:hypothetical protein